jgi:LDH2 family malate/lactate/ureidoglycolate dehydrogenase
VSPPRVRLPATALRALVSELFLAVGASREHADTIADALVWADLRGVDSHGVRRAPRHWIDVTAFAPAELFRAVVDDTIDAVKALPRTDPAAAPLVPGERGARELDDRQARGIPLPAPLRDELRSWATRLGVTPPAEL